VSGPCVLYRQFNTEGALLYVGISQDNTKRQTVHRATSPWGEEIDRVTTEIFPTRLDALKAEASAIKDESPKYNKKWEVPRETPSTPPASMALTLTIAIDPPILGYLRRQADSRGVTTAQYASAVLRIAIESRESRFATEIVPQGATSRQINDAIHVAAVAICRAAPSLTPFSMFQRSIMILSLKIAEIAVFAIARWGRR
jgi:hypothetical protein